MSIQATAKAAAYALPYNHSVGPFPNILLRQLLFFQTVPTYILVDKKWWWLLQKAAWRK